MPVPLIYDIVIKDDKLAKAFRGVESEAKAAASRVDREFGRVGTSSRARVGQDPRSRQVARGFDQIGRAARAADAAVIRARMRDDRRAEAERVRGIERVAKAEQRANEKAAATKIRAAERAGRGSARTIGSGVGKVVGFGANALALGAGVLGGLGATSALEDEIQVRAKASQLANQARTPELKGTLAKESGQLQGFTRMESLGALEQFVNLTGDLKTARALLPDLGKLALATGTDIQELAATAGNAFIPIADQIKEPTKQLETMKDVLAAIAGQGTVGAVEIKDLAKDFAGLAATSNRFAGRKGDVLKMMGAIAQASRQRGGSSSAAEAVTSVERFASDLVTKSASGGRHTGAQAAKMMGIDVFTDKTKTQLKNPEEIIIEILKKTKGDLTKVGGIFGARSMRAFQGFAPLYTEAERAKPGTGEAAVRAEFARLLNAQVSAPEIAQRAGSRLGDEDIKLKEAAKRFNESVGGQLIPAVNDLIPQFTDMLPKLTEFAGVVANVTSSLIKHPWEGLGAVVGLAITAEIGKAAIGASVEAAIASLLARVAAAGGVTAVAGSALSATGGALLGVGGKIGLGAAGSAALGVGAAAVGAAAGVGAAGYNLYKLHEETKNEGGAFESLRNAWNGPARASTPEEYDAMMRKAGINREAQGGPGKTASLDASAANKQLEQGAARAADIIAQKLASANIGPDRRTNPVIRR